MIDIAPQLLEDIQKEFNTSFNKNSKIKAIKKLIESGKATYSNANDYAIEVGNILARVFKNNITPDSLPDGRMYFNIAERILTPTLGNNHNLIAEISAQIQTNLNTTSGLGIKGILIKINQDRIKGFIDRVASEIDFKEVAWILDEPVINYSQSVVDDTIKANAEMHDKLGLSPKIVRTLVGGACPWCVALAGTFDYPDVPDDLYKRHDRCRCTVEYNPGDGKKQDVYSKKWL